MVDKLSLKLLIDRKSQKVLFAEAEKDFVDFLLNLLTLPVGSVVRLLKKNNVVGCTGQLYEGFQNLSDNYIQPGQNKTMLLNPVSPSVPLGRNHPLLLQNDARGKSMKVYTCSVRNRNYCIEDGYQSATDHGYVTDVYGVACPSCKKEMTTEKTYVASNAASLSSWEGEEGGFVKEVVAYTVMDDLEMKPMSTISSIAILNSFNVKDVGSLEESMVEVGMDEVYLYV